MIRANDLLRKNNFKPYRYIKEGNITIIETSNGKVVCKKNSNKALFEYLNTRNFINYPKIIDANSEIDLIEYIEEVEYPNEQKILDLVTLLGVLHSKTNHYQEVDFDAYKEIYEDITNNIEYLYSYYIDHITHIETKVFLSPSQYLFVRNFSSILVSLNYCKYEIKNWYDLVKEKTKKRVVVLHNNIDLSHFLKKKDSYFISWNKSKFGISIFDLYILYKRHGLEYDFSDILLQYEKIYPLQEDERKLLFVLIALPSKLNFSNNEFELTKEISKMYDLMYKTEKLIASYNTTIST